MAFDLQQTEAALRQELGALERRLAARWPGLECTLGSDGPGKLDATFLPAARAEYAGGVTVQCRTEERGDEAVTSVVVMTNTGLVLQETGAQPLEPPGARLPSRVRGEIAAVEDEVLAYLQKWRG